MRKKLLNRIKQSPSEPGIYLFFDKNKNLLYVGKATNLKSRIKSYFSGQKTTRPIENLIHEVESIDWLKTNSVLEAIILEASEIKKHRPKYNVLGKDDKSWNYLYLTNEEFPTLKAVREHELKQKNLSKKDYLKIWGPFPGLKTDQALKILRKLFNYSDCQPDQEKACFYHQIEQCLGVCTGEITAEEYRKKVIKPLSSFLSGKTKTALKTLQKQMNQVSQEENFEEAIRIREQIKNLKKIQDITLLNKTFFHDQTIFKPNKKENQIFRIEGYDISNLGSTGKVGSLVFFENGVPNKSQYRKFKIKTVKGQSDIDCLKEVLTRRLKHREWKYPDLFLIDGGRPQINAAKQILQEQGSKQRQKTPIVGIAKGPQRRKNEFFITEQTIEPWLKKNKNLLIKVRDEAHRFALKYQRSLRKIK